MARKPPDAAPGGVPYERRPGESAQAFAAFAAYRDAGPGRSLDAVGRQLYGARKGRKRGATGRLRSWSRRWQWVERARAWDDAQDRASRQAQQQAREEAAARHVKAAVALQTKALARLQRMRPAELGPAAVLRFLVEAIKLERTARGEPEAVTEQRQKVEAHHTVAADLFADVAQYADVLRQLRDRRVAGSPVPADGPQEPVGPTPADAQAGGVPAPDVS